MHRHALHHVLRKPVRASVFVTLIGAFDGVRATQDDTETAAAAPAGLTGAPTASAPVASTPTTPPAKAKEQHERLAGSFWQGTVGKGTDNPGRNVWLNVYGPPPKEQDVDKDPMAGTLTDKAYDDRPQDHTLWTIEGRDVPEHRFVWRERAEALNSAGQPVVREGGTLSDALSTDDSTTADTWSDDSRSQPFMLKRVTRYHEFTGVFGQAKLTERYPVAGDTAVNALIQSLRMRKCGQYDTECVVRINAVGLGDTVSLLRMVWAYNDGAHGSYSFAAGNWRRTGQGFQPIALTEMLKPVPACLQSFNTQIVDTLKREGTPDAPHGAPKGRDLHNATFPFTLQGDRIVVHYGPYEAGSYPPGAFHAAVRFDSLDTTRKRPVT